jgi:hypothetical protein
MVEGFPTRRRRERGPRPAPRTPESHGPTSPERTAPRAPERTPTAPPEPWSSRRTLRRLKRAQRRARAVLDETHHPKPPGSPLYLGSKAVGATGGILYGLWSFASMATQMTWKQIGFGGEFWKTWSEDIKNQGFLASLFKGGGGGGGGGRSSSGGGH